MGPLMMLTSLLAIVSDFSTSYLVRDAEVSSLCGFKGGMTFMPSQPVGNMSGNVATYPDVYGEAFSWANTAQFISSMNLGPVGIYRMVDGNVYFKAQESDIVGNWTCEVATTSFPANTTYDEVTSECISNGALYNYTYSGQRRWFHNGDQAPRNEYQQLFAWTASSPGYNSTTEPPGSPWNVRALIDWNDHSSDEWNFDIAHCTVTGEHEEYINNVLAYIDADDTLASWSPAVQGQLYHGVNGPKYEDSAGTLVLYLNSMIMVAASRQFIGSQSNDTEKIGCVVTHTRVPGFIIMLVVVVALLVLGLSGYGIALFISFRNVKGAYDKQSVKNFLQRAPGSLAEWMANALRESKIAAARDAMPKHLKDWDFMAELGSPAHTRFFKRGEAAYSQVVESDYEQRQKAAV